MQGRRVPLLGAGYCIQKGRCFEPVADAVELDDEGKTLLGVTPE
jgi:hypothetical protein